MLKEEVLGTDGDLNFDRVNDDLVTAGEVEKYALAIREAVWEKGLMGGKMENIGDSGRKVEEIGLMDANGDLKKLFSHTVTAADMPMEQLHYRCTGDLGFSRGWRDFGAAGSAGGANLGFIKNIPRFKEVGDYKKAMESIEASLADFNADYAKEYMGHLTNVICEANSLVPFDQYAPAPIPFVTDLFGAVERPRSYMEKVYGRGAARWNMINKRRFIDEMFREGWITQKMKEDLLKRHHAHFPNLTGEAVLKYGPFVLGAIAFLFLRQLAKELEETAKEDS